MSKFKLYKYVKFKTLENSIFYTRKAILFINIKEKKNFYLKHVNERISRQKQLFQSRTAVNIKYTVWILFRIYA